MRAFDAKSFETAIKTPRAERGWLAVATAVDGAQGQIQATLTCYHAGTQAAATTASSSPAHQTMS
jgi:hypothetical protein